MSTVPEQSVELLTGIVAKRVRGLRGELGLTQADLGRALGMSTASVSERLRGDTKFDINELPALSSLLGESIPYLLGLTDVRHEGLEPPTRWFAVTTPLNVVPGGIQEPARALAPVATEEPLEQLATVLPFHRPARGRLLHGPRRPRPRSTDEQAS